MGLECYLRSHQMQHHNPKHHYFPILSHPEDLSTATDFSGPAFVHLSPVWWGRVHCPAQAHFSSHSSVVIFPLITPDIYTLQSFTELPPIQHPDLDFVGGWAMTGEGNREKSKGVLLDAKSLQISQMYICPIDILSHHPCLSPPSFYCRGQGEVQP